MISKATIRKQMIILAFLLFVAVIWLLIVEFGIRTADTYEKIDWPPLPTTGYMRGLAATRADVNAGRAGMSMTDHRGRVVGSPMAIMIPQYAVYVNQRTKKRTPGIVIQAEEGLGARVIVMRSLDGQLISGNASEFKLLGTNTPSGIF